ncbi:hypothetical protein DL769_003540 [Monosporascus sp. CRB-8-3]|nr:hypothetical protein DL769_003540 [Monosporascus sp. CRB-8-3]
MGVSSNIQAVIAPDTINGLLVVIAVATLYGTYLVTYRLFFHPLRKIPGPYLAAATYWYEFYEDIVLRGHYVKSYPKLHAKYGPVVRVSPDRVHVSDPEFFHEVYSSGTKYLKDPAFFQTSGGINEALPALVDPDYHKQRRHMIKSLFSTKSIEQLSGVVLDVIQRALDKAVECHRSGSPLDVQRLYTGITIDTIMRVLCDKQLNLVESIEEEPPFLVTMRTFSENFFLTKHFPILATIASNIPSSWSDRLLPGYAQFRQQVAQWIEEIQNKHKKGIYSGSDGRQTIIDLLLKPEAGYAPLSKESLVDEVNSFCFAGTHTTSFSLTLATYYLLKNPPKLEKLLRELETVKRNSEGLLEYRDVSNLPYLTAVMKESLRLASPVPGVTPRLVPAGGITWAGHYLPGGTSVSIAIRTVHDNPDLFPEPASFIPERWLAPEASDHWLVVFGKGPRSCIGLNVAYMESYLCIANFFSRLDMSLYKTNEQSIEWDDCGNAMLHEPVRVTVDALK